MCRLTPRTTYPNGGSSIGHEATSWFCMGEFKVERRRMGGKGEVCLESQGVWGPKPSSGAPCIWAPVPILGSALQSHLGPSRLPRVCPVSELGPQSLPLDPPCTGPQSLPLDPPCTGLQSLPFSLPFSSAGHSDTKPDSRPQQLVARSAPREMAVDTVDSSRAASAVQSHIAWWSPLT